MIFNFLRLACFQLACHIPTVGQVGVVEAASIKCGGGGVGGGGGGGGGGVVMRKKSGHPGSGGSIGRRASQRFSRILEGQYRTYTIFIDISSSQMPNKIRMEVF